MMIDLIYRKTTILVELHVQCTSYSVHGLRRITIISNLEIVMIVYCSNYNGIDLDAKNG